MSRSSVSGSFFGFPFRQNYETMTIVTKSVKINIWKMCCLSMVVLRKIMRFLYYDSVSYVCSGFLDGPFAQYFWRSFMDVLSTVLSTVGGISPKSTEWHSVLSSRSTEWHSVLSLQTIERHSVLVGDCLSTSRRLFGQTPLKVLNGIQYCWEGFL